MADRLAQMRKMGGGVGHHDYSQAVYNDWNERDYVENIQLNILQIAKFLNEFERCTKFKLACVNEKMTKLERTIEYCESSIKVHC